MQLPSIRCPFRLSFRRESLDRGNPAVMCLGCWDQAGHDCLSIQPDGAGSTLAFGAAFLRTSQPGIFTQHIQQRLLLCIGHQIGLTVDDGGDGTIKWTGWRR